MKTKMMDILKNGAVLLLFVCVILTVMEDHVQAMRDKNENIMTEINDSFLSLDSSMLNYPLNIKTNVDMTRSERDVIFESWGMLYTKIPNVMKSFAANNGRIYYCDSADIQEIAETLEVTPTNVRFGAYFPVFNDYQTLWITNESLCYGNHLTNRNISLFHTEIALHEMIHYWDNQNSISSSYEFIALYRNYKDYCGFSSVNIGDSIFDEKEFLAHLMVDYFLHPETAEYMPIELHIYAEQLAKTL